MTLSRETIDIALVAINRRRAHHRSALGKLAGHTAATTNAAAGHRRELERLTAAHAELAAELELVKAAGR